MSLIGCGGDTEIDSSPKMTPEPSSAGAKLLKKYCSACHGMPHPTVHLADEWKNVVARMQTHRIKKAYDPLSEDEQKTLVLYLKKHAKT